MHFSNPSASHAAFTFITLNNLTGIHGIIHIHTPGARHGANDETSLLGEYSVYSVKIQKCRKDDTTVLYDQTIS